MKQLNDEFYKSIYPHLSFLDDVSLNADGNDTVRLITKTINQYATSPFVKYCVKVIDGISKNEFEFCKNLFYIACKLVRYRRDPEGHEIVFTPLLLARVREGDCKKFTTLICAILKCRGIASASKVVTYEEPLKDGTIRWQHIYAIAFPKSDSGSKDYLILDPVNYQMFNVEVEHRIGRVNYYDGSTSKPIMSKLSLMGNVPPKNETFFGLGWLGDAAGDFLGDVEEISGRRRTITPKVMHEIEQDYIEGVGDYIDGPDDDMSGLDEIGKKNKAQRQAQRKVNKAKRVEKRKKIFKGVKKVGLAPVRAAFLTLIGAGDLLQKYTKIKFNLAAKLAELWKKDGGASLIKIWQNFGGKKEALKKALEKHAHTQLSGGIYGIPIKEAGGIGEPATTAGIIVSAAAVAAPILILVIKLLYQKSVLKKQQAAEAADATEHLEDTSTDKDGNLNPNLVDAVKKNVPIVKEVFSMDDGGDKQAQKEITQARTPNDQTDSSQKSSYEPPPAARPQNEGGGGGGEQQQQQQQQSDQPENKTHAGFNLLGASSWLTGSFQVQLIAQSFGINETLAGAAGAIMLAGSVFLFIRKKLF